MEKARLSIRKTGRFHQQTNKSLFASFSSEKEDSYFFLALRAA
jgi:hypothetical protein